MNEKAIKLRAFNVQTDKVLCFEISRAKKSFWKRNKRLFKIKPLTLGVITLMGEQLIDVLDKTEIKNPQIYLLIKFRKKFLNALSIAITGGRIDEKIIKFINDNCTTKEIRVIISQLMMQANYEDFFFSIKYIGIMNPGVNDKIEDSQHGKSQTSHVAGTGGHTTM